jgi:hypothetical protein
MRSCYGWIEIDGIRYDHDVIVHRDLSVEKRSKKKSRQCRGFFKHTPLADIELAFLKKEKPDVVYIGTGQFDDLPITTEALKILAKFRAIIRPTPEIMKLLSSEYRSYAAILHVKC